MKLNNIKESFDNRKIEPSIGAWDTLASRLDQEENKSKKPVILWLSAIAAVLILGVFIYPILSSEIVIKKGSSNEVVIDQTKPTEVIPVNKVNVNPVNDAQVDQLKDFNDLQQAVALSEEKNEKSKSIINNNNSKNIKIEDVGAVVPNPEVNSAISFTDSPKNSIIEDNSIDPKIIVEVVEVSPKKLTAEEEMELLLNQAIENVEAKEYAVKNINIDQLVRETEWDIEADRRNRFNNYLYDQLGKLKKEAVATITGRK